MRSTQKLQTMREKSEPSADVPTGAYRRPTVDVISLSCEISAYAPDEDDLPLF